MLQKRSVRLNDREGNKKSNIITQGTKIEVIKHFEVNEKLTHVGKVLGITCCTIFKSAKMSNPGVNNSNLEAYAYPEIYFVNGFAIKIFKYLYNYHFLSDTYLNFLPLILSFKFSSGSFYF